MNTESQNKKLKEHLLKGWSITALDALDRYGIFRLASRINDLRNSGLSIQTDMIHVKNRDSKPVRIARYQLINQL